MRGLRAIFRSVLALVVSLSCADAIMIHGEKLIPKNGAVFLAKFCFDYDKTSNRTGLLDLKMTGAFPPVGDMKFVLLNDVADSYPDSSSRWPGFDCNDQRLHDVARSEWTVELANLKNNNWFHTYIVETLRPRYWFIAALDCSGVARTITYDLHMLNFEQGWQQEISMDHVGVVTLCGFLMLYFIAGLSQTHAVFLQSHARTKHPLRLLLALALWSALWGMAFYTFDTVWQAFEGVDSFILYLAAKCFKATSKFTLLLVLILLSRGRGISRELHSRDIMYGAIVIAPFLIVCLGLELYGEYDQSQTYTTNFLYDTMLGGVLVVADLVLLGLYVSNLLRSYREESNSDKKSFYRNWGAVYSLSFLNLPLTAIVAMYIAPHVRVEVMFIFSNVIHAALLALLVVGLWPSHSHAAFQIDKGADLVCTFGNQAGNLLDEELKTGDYREFNIAEEGDQI